MEARRKIEAETQNKKDPSKAVKAKPLLAEHRRRRAMRQRDVALALGIPTATYANWEQGRTEPDLESLRRLSRILGVPTDRLLGIRDRDVVQVPRARYEKVAKAMALLVSFLEEEREDPAPGRRRIRKKAKQK